MPRDLMIVSRGRESLYDELRVMYEQSERVQVILDRRINPDRRRARPAWPEPERRRGERRQRRPDFEEHLQLLGWALTRTS